MSLSAAVIDALVASGCTAEQLAAAVKAANADSEARATHKRGVDAARKRREREAKAAVSNDVTRTERDISDVPSLPDKENPQTPKEINPPAQTPNPDGLATPSDEIGLAVKAYSEMATRAGLAVPRVVDGARRQRIAAIVRRRGLPIWLEAVAKVEASDFCRGANERGWRADLDFVTQPKSFAGLLEGRYDNRARGSPATVRAPSQSDVFKRIAERAANGQDGDDRGRLRPALSDLRTG